LRESSKPVLAVTPGEPAGIGPDLCLQLAQQQIDARLVIFADPELLVQRQQQLGLDIDIQVITARQIPDINHRPGSLHVVALKQVCPTVTGKLNSKNALYVLKH